LSKHLFYFAISATRCGFGGVGDGGGDSPDVLFPLTAPSRRLYFCFWFLSAVTPFLPSTDAPKYHDELLFAFLFLYGPPVVTPPDDRHRPVSSSAPLVDAVLFLPSPPLLSVVCFGLPLRATGR